MDRPLKEKLANYEREIDKIIEAPPYSRITDQELETVVQAIFKKILARFQAGVENQGEMSLTLSLLGDNGRPASIHAGDWPLWAEFCQWWDESHMKCVQNSGHLKKVLVGLLMSKTRQALLRIFERWSHPLVQLKILDESQVMVSIVI